MSLLLSAGSAGGHDPSRHGFDLVRFEPSIPAPALEGVDVDGRGLSLDEFRGDYVLLNFWATWCPPCIEEMPSLERLERRFGDRGLVVLAVTSEDDAARRVPPFIETLGIELTVLLDLDGQVAAAYGVRNLPSTFLVDREGAIIAAAQGVRDWSSEAALSVFDELVTPTVRLARAAVLLLTALGCASTPAEDDPVVATVNGHAIRLSEVYRQIETLPLGDQIAVRERFEQFIEAMIREEVLFQSMIATDFAGEPSLRDRLKTAVVEHLIERQVQDRTEISADAVRAYYEENASVVREENVAASQIVLASYEECETLLETIDSDQAFAEAARARSLDEESAPQGGALGRFMNHSGPYGFEEMLFLLQPGQMAIFESQRGCHLVRVTDRELPPLPPIEEVEERIRTLLAQREERRLLGELVERAEEKVRVERPPP